MLGYQVTESHTISIDDLIRQLIETKEKYGNIEIFSGLNETWHDDLTEVFVKDNGYGIIRAFIGNG